MNYIRIGRNENKECTNYMDWWNLIGQDRQ